MKPSLSPQERRILGVVELDAHRSSREVAKQLRIQDYTVQHALRRLRERGAIQIRPFIDVARLGKTDVGVFFSLGLTQQRAYAKFMKKLVDSPQVAFVQSLAGDYHFIASLHCYSLHDAQRFVHSLSEWSGGAVISKTVVPRVRYYQYRRKYLTGVLKHEPALVALESVEHISLSREEHQLLTYLSHTPPESIRHAARALGQPSSSVDHRYKQLLDKEIVRGWFYDIAQEFLPVQSFKLLISCRQVAPDFLKSIERFARYHPNVAYILETLGSWDFEIGVECIHAGEITALIALLHETFPNHISAIRSLTELNTYKFSMFPGEAR